MQETTGRIDTTSIRSCLLVNSESVTKFVFSPAPKKKEGFVVYTSYKAFSFALVFVSSHSLEHFAFFLNLIDTAPHPSPIFLPSERHMARGKFKKPQRGGGRTFSRRIEAVHTHSSSAVRVLLHIIFSFFFFFLMCELNFSCLRNFTDPFFLPWFPKYREKTQDATDSSSGDEGTEKRTKEHTSESESESDSESESASDPEQDDPVAVSVFFNIN
ncbi:unnamed protein product [Mortierella alpina]